MAFASLADFKTALRIPLSNTAQDALLQDALDGADAMLLTYFGLTSTDPTTYTLRALVDPTFCEDAKTFALETIPVLELVAVRKADVEQDVALYYVSDTGWVRFAGIDFPGDTRSRSLTAVEFDVVAGFDPVPADLRRGAIALAAMLRTDLTQNGLKSEQMGRYRYERFDPEQLAKTGFLPLTTWLALRKYQRYTAHATFASHYTPVVVVPDP